MSVNEKTEYAALKSFLNSFDGRLKDDLSLYVATTIRPELFSLEDYSMEEIHEHAKDYVNCLIDVLKSRYEYELKSQYFK